MLCENSYREWRYFFTVGSFEGSPLFQGGRSIGLCSFTFGGGWAFVFYVLLPLEFWIIEVPIYMRWRTHKAKAYYREGLQLPPRFFKCLFLRDRREHTRREEAERERQRQTQRIPTRLCIIRVEPNEGLEFMNCEIMT